MRRKLHIAHVGHSSGCMYHLGVGQNWRFLFLICKITLFMHVSKGIDRTMLDPSVSLDLTLFMIN